VYDNFSKLFQPVFLSFQVLNLLFFFVQNSIKLKVIRGFERKTEFHFAFPNFSILLAKTKYKFLTKVYIKKSILVLF